MNTHGSASGERPDLLRRVRARCGSGVARGRSVDAAEGDVQPSHLLERVLQAGAAADGVGDGDLPGAREMRMVDLAPSAVRSPQASRQRSSRSLRRIRWPDCARRGHPWSACRVGRRRRSPRSGRLPRLLPGRRRVRPAPGGAETSDFGNLPTDVRAARDLQREGRAGVSQCVTVGDAPGRSPPGSPHRRCGSSARSAKSVSEAGTWARCAG